MPAAVVTMVYNESDFLPIWLSYYEKQFGSTSCYIIDHGSDDGSTTGLGLVNVVRIPRSPMHDKKRASYISRFCSALLEWYDTVVYTDVDEILVADPDYYPSLIDLCVNNKAAAVTAVGFNVTHIPSVDPALDLSRPILEQRRWARFSFAMCKPLIVRADTTWTPGFHSSSHPLVFDHLFLFHLHHFDRPRSLRRLAKTRTMPWGDGPPNHYQRWTDERHEEIADAIAGLPRIESSTFREDDPVLSTYVNWMTEYVTNNPTQRHLFYYQNGVPANELLRIPDRFIGII